MNFTLQTNPVTILAIQEERPSYINNLEAGANEMACSCAYFTYKNKSRKKENDQREKQVAKGLREDFPKKGE